MKKTVKKLVRKHSGAVLPRETASEVVVQSELTRTTIIRQVEATEQIAEGMKALALTTHSLYTMLNQRLNAMAFNMTHPEEKVPADTVVAVSSVATPAKIVTTVAAARAAGLTIFRSKSDGPRKLIRIHAPVMVAAKLLKRQPVQKGQ